MPDRPVPADDGPTGSAGNLARALDVTAGTRVLVVRPAAPPDDDPLLEVLRSRGAVTTAAVTDGAHGTDDGAPAEASLPAGEHDVVLVVGALETAGGGDRDAVVRLLRACRDRLAPRGALVVAAANALGVRYLAGAVDDLTGRPLDPLEGYLLPGRGRALTRTELLVALAAAGLHPSVVLGAFPDHDAPRVLLTDGLLERSPDLAARLPRFPSTDRASRLQLADEGRLWTVLACDGGGRHAVNAHVVIAHGGDGGTVLWPTDRLAMMFNTERQPRYATSAEVVVVGGAVELRRRRLRAVGEADDGIRHTPPEVEPEHVGEELLQRALDRPDERSELLRRWAGLVPHGEWMPVDLVPHNVLVQEDGSLAVVDQEWHVRGYARESVLLRGLLWAAVRIALTSRRPADATPQTIGDVVRGLARELGPEGPDLDDVVLVDRFVEEESAFQAAVNTDGAVEEERRRRSAEGLRALLEQDVTEARGGLRFDVQWQQARAQLARHAELFAEQAEREAELTAEVELLRARLDGSFEERLRRRLHPVLDRARVLRGRRSGAGTPPSPAG